MLPERVQPRRGRVSLSRADTSGGLTAWKFIKFNISWHFAKNGILPVQLNAAECHSLHLQMRSSDWSRHLVDHCSTEIAEI